MEISADASDTDVICIPKWQRTRSRTGLKVGPVVLTRDPCARAYICQRFHRTPTFGRDTTIRRFPGNVSGLSKLAARDYEDILQVRGLRDDGISTC